MLASRTVRLADAWSDEAVAVLARAFFDDPQFVYLEPDDDRRRPLMPLFMSVGVRYGRLFGEAYATDPQPLGGAIWLPPGHTEVLPDRLAEAGMAAAEEAAGPDAMARFGAFMEVGAMLHRRDMPMPHWYLMILGVDPPVQGRGLGGSLIQPVLDRADRDGLPLSLIHI